jgi:hypothetical protein
MNVEVHLHGSDNPDFDVSVYRMKASDTIVCDGPFKRNFVSECMETVKMFHENHKNC